MFNFGMVFQLACYKYDITMSSVYPRKNTWKSYICTRDLDQVTRYGEPYVQPQEQIRSETEQR